MNSKSIGIFDSGMGGLSVLDLAMKKLPNEKFIYYGDSVNAPYGTKTKAEVVDLSVKICDYLISRDVKAIIVACNTATSAAVKILRKKYDIPIIGMEPALKPAIENNQGGSIAVMATPMTLREEKFKNLLTDSKSDNKIYKIPAPKIVDLVEKGITNGEQMDAVLSEYFNFLDTERIESVVLGCTHFIFIKESILKCFDHKVKLYDGNEGTINQLVRVLSKTNQLEKSAPTNEENIELLNTGGASYIGISKNLLKSLRGAEWK